MSNKPETIVIKVGTAALTNRMGYPDESAINPIVNQIADLKEAGHAVYLVTSGAVGTGRSVLKNGEIPPSFDETLQKQHLAAIGQPDLMQIYGQLFAWRGLKREQVLLERAHFGPDGNDVKSLFKRVMGAVCDFPELRPNQYAMKLLKSFKQMPHVVPVINENDTTAISELMFTDNDDLAGRIAREVKADKFIILSNIDGVYTSNPKVDKSATVIPTIDFADPATLPASTNGKSGNGRGGMDTKMATAEVLARAGIQVHIANSRTPDVINRILEGEAVGTRLVYSRPKPNPQTSWMIRPPFA